MKDKIYKKIRVIWSNGDHSIWWVREEDIKELEDHISATRFEGISIIPITGENIKIVNWSHVREVRIFKDAEE